MDNNNFGHFRMQSRQAAYLRFEQSPCLWIIRCFVWHISLTHSYTMMFMSIKSTWSRVIQTWRKKRGGGQGRGQHPEPLTRPLLKSAAVHECSSVCQTDGFWDKACDWHLQSVRETESSHCCVQAVVTSSARIKRRETLDALHAFGPESSNKYVSGTVLTKEREVWSCENKGSEDYPSGKECNRPNVCVLARQCFEQFWSGLDVDVLTFITVTCISQSFNIEPMFLIKLDSLGVTLYPAVKWILLSLLRQCWVTVP